MTFGSANQYAFTAESIVNNWDEEDIANVIFAYGEERLARRIAKAIVEYRTLHPITSSKQLADLIEERFGRKGRGFGSFSKSKTHPATKTFQALRIAVNNELEHLRIALEKALEVLKPGGKMAVIAYHSLEDRIVKQYVKGWAKLGKVKELTKKPTVPSEEEIKTNPRSRSAKLRVIEKI
jgi:16S rRNA (cytosine1402-N4)-methyltransferase